MSLANQNEFSLIQKIRKSSRSAHPSILKSIGDDAAVIDPDFAHRLVVTTDLMVENVHFKTNWLSPYLLGRKSLAVNWSDLAAMGARPYACVLNLALPQAGTSRFFDEFMKGFLEECVKAGASLVGGDLSRSECLLVGVTAWGYLESGEPRYRSDAMPGDRLLLIGEVGYAGRGLEILQSEEFPGLNSVDSEDRFAACVGDFRKFRFVKAHCLPEAQIEPAVWLQQNGLARAMIDISDGLAQDLLHLCRESGVAAELDVDEITPPEVTPRERARELALNGGEDYALLFSASEEQLGRLLRNYPRHLPPFRNIGGFFEGEPAVYLGPAQDRKRYQPRGFNHFR